MEDTNIDDIANLPMPKPKKTINRVQLNELTLLQENKGLKKLYNESKKLVITGDSKNDMKKLMNLYKEWHFGVAPRFEFNYFVQKCQVLGTKAPIRSFMTRIRKVHTGQITWEEIENPGNSGEANARNEDFMGDFIDEELAGGMDIGANKENNKDIGRNRIEIADDVDEMEYLNNFAEIEQEADQDELDYLNSLAMEEVGPHERMEGLDESEVIKKLKMSED